jgi:hypothetical protein
MFYIRSFCLMVMACFAHTVDAMNISLDLQEVVEPVNRRVMGVCVWFTHLLILSYQMHF